MKFGALPPILFKQSLPGDIQTGKDKLGGANEAQSINNSKPIKCN